MIAEKVIQHATVYDCIVVGGGMAGVAAATAAARRGATVLLLEKSCALGGLATLGLINWFEPICNRDGKRVVRGLAEEMLARIVQTGRHTLPVEWREFPATAQTTHRFASFFSPSLTSLMLLDLATEAGVRVVYDALATYPDVEDGCVRRVRVETKSGTEYYACRTVVDATGDADVFLRAGAPTVDGKNYLSYVAHCYPKDAGTDFPAFYTWLLTGAGMDGSNQPKTVAPFVGISNEDENVFLQYGQRELWKHARSDERELLALPGMAQYRTTRHIAAAYTLTERDVNARSEDAVGVVNDFREARRYLEIPYRALYCEGYGNMLAAGRIIGADGDAWQITRVIPTCVLTGEVCGEAVALSLQQGVSVDKLDVGLLRRRLREKGLLLHRTDVAGEH